MEPGHELRAIQKGAGRPVCRAWAPGVELDLGVKILTQGWVADMKGASNGHREPEALDEPLWPREQVGCPLPELGVPAAVLAAT